MFTSIKLSILIHFRRNIFMYILLTAVFAIGVAVGCLTVNNIADSQTVELKNFIQNFLANYNNSSQPSGTIMFKSFFGNLQTLLVIWAVGLTVVGAPAIIGAVGYKGYLFGFCVGIFVKFYASKGLLFAAATILPQMIFSTFAYIFLGVMSINFSLTIINLIRQKVRITEGFGYKVAGYAMKLIVAVVLILCASAIDGYVVPQALSLAINFMR